MAPVDQVAFQARVRTERRRRNAGRALIGVAAAAAVVTAGIVGNAALDEPESTPLANVPGEAEVAVGSWTPCSSSWTGGSPRSTRAASYTTSGSTAKA